MEKNQLSTFAYFNLSDQEEYHGYHLPKGIHIRWQISRYVGFPKNGFKIYDDQDNVIKKVNLPNTHQTFLEQAQEGVSNPALLKIIRSRFYRKLGVNITYLDQIIQSIQKIKSTNKIPQYLIKDSFKGNEISHLDLLLISSVDPYMAKGLGLYTVLSFTDSWYSSPLNKFSYKVEGDWGDTQYSYLIDNVSKIPLYPEPLDLLELEHLQMQPLNREIKVLLDELTNQKYILNSGEVFTPWKILLKQEVKELVLYFASSDDISLEDIKQFKWSIYDREIHPLIITIPYILKEEFQYKIEEVTLSSNKCLKFRIYKQNKAESFNQVYFQKSPMQLKIINRIEYIQKPTEFIDIISDTTNKTSWKTLEQYSLDKHYIPTLQLGQFLKKQSQPFFNKDGHILKKASDVFLKTKYCYYPANDFIPVRFQLKRKNSLSKFKILTVDEDTTLQPQLLSQSVPKSYLPHLLVYFPFNGSLENKKNGALSKHIGLSRYQLLAIGTGLKLLDRTRSDSYLQLDGSVLSKIGKRFTISIKTKLRIDNSNSVIIHTENSATLFLGFNSVNQIVFKWNGEAFTTKYSLNDDYFRSGNNDEVWLLVSYNEGKISINCRPILDEHSSVHFGNTDSNQNYWANLTESFYSNIFQGSEYFDASQSTILNSVGNHIYIGKSSGDYKGYKGVLKDISTWKDCLTYYDLYSKQTQLQTLINYQSKAALQFTFIDRITLIENNGYSIPKLYSIGYLSKVYTIQFWVKQNISVTKDKVTQKIFFLEGNTENNELSVFEIYRQNNEKYIDFFRIYENNSELDVLGDSNAKEIIGQDWYKVTINFNQDNSSIWINNTHLFSFTNYKPIVLPTKIVIGEKQGDQFTHLTLWNEALTPDQIDERLGSAQYIDRQLLDGKYDYQIKGVDLLGRIAKKGFSKTVTCKASLPDIDVPTSTFAKMTSLSGNIKSTQAIVEILKKVKKTSLGEEITKEIEKTKFELTIEEANFNFNLATSLIKHYLTIHRIISGRNVSQRFEIFEAKQGNGSLVLTCYEPIFNQVTPKAGDKFTIDIDLKATIECSWTGLQQVYNPEVDHFLLYTYLGDRNTVVSKVLKVLSSNEKEIRKTYTFTIDKVPIINENNQTLFEGLFARIGHNSYEINKVVKGSPTTDTEITVTANAYGMPPVLAGQDISIVLNSDFDEYQSFNEAAHWDSHPMHINLKPDLLVTSIHTSVELEINKVSLQEMEARGIHWFPEKRLIKVSLFPSGITNTPTNPKVDGYVPSALVAKIPTNYKEKWDAFTVLWHEWHNTTLECYVLIKEDTIKENIPLTFKNAKFYEGKQYQHTYNFLSLPDFEEISKVSYAFGIAAIGEEGNSSKISAPANVVLVDKRIPEAPEGPTAASDRIADYYKKIKVDISWHHINGKESYYNIYSSSFATIAATDLESRRLRRGAYKKAEQNKSLAFQGDHHWRHWIETVNARTWQDPMANNESFRVTVSETNLAALFPDQYDTNEPHKESKAWRRMSIIWQNWAERFYTALSDEEKAFIAETEGNEEAFTLLNTKPLLATAYTDEVTGYHPDVFFYRVRAQSKSLVTNMEWSPVSNPVKPKLCRKPRKPELSKVIPGDRSITLYWNLNREPQLSHYLIYRADTKEALEDLRWWRDYPDPRIVGRVDDPRIKTKNNAITIKPNDPIKEIIGVYKASEYNYNEDESIGYKGAFNYWNAQESVLELHKEKEGFYILSLLKPIAEYTPVVIVYNTEEGEMVVQYTVVAHQKLTVQKGTLKLPPFLEIKEIIGIYKANEFDKTATPITNQTAKNYYYLDDMQAETAIWIENTEGDTIYNLVHLEENINVVLVYIEKNDFMKVVMNFKIPLKFEDKDLVGLKEYNYIISSVINLNNLFVSNYSSKAKISSLLIKNNRSLEVELTRTKKSESIDLITIKIPSLANEIEVLVKFKEINEDYWSTTGSWKKAMNGTIINFESDRFNSLVFEVITKESGVLNESQFYYLNPIN